jgi:hypothetical protein
MILVKLPPVLVPILAIFDRNCIDFSGTQSDPLAALVLCGPVKPRHVMTAGRMVVTDGMLSRLDLGRLTYPP